MLSDSAIDFLGTGNKTRRLRLLICFTALCCIFSLVSCNPIYVLEAAYEQSVILINSRPLEEVIEDSSTAENDRLKLRLVGVVREFATTVQLNPGETFTTYTELRKDPVAWVVSASRKDLFEPYSWWFPIVGSVPYKGFFDKDDALCVSRELESEGLETWVRGTAAFSTLGWFDDPLLSSTLKLSTLDVINTVLHEMVHTTVWVPGSVAFNESLANYVAHRAAIDFFVWLQQQQISYLSPEQISALMEEARTDLVREIDLSVTYERIYQSLVQLYASNLNSEIKISQRQQLAESHLADFQARYPDRKMDFKVNNAEIMQRRLYLRNLRDFDRLFISNSSDWKSFFSDIRRISEESSAEEESIFAQLEKEAVQL